MYSKTANVHGQCFFSQRNKLVPAVVPAACRTACTLYTWRRWSRPPPPTSDLNIFLSKSNKSVLLPFLNLHGLALKLHKICTQKLSKFLDDVCYYTQTSWFACSGTSCLQHSLHPVHVEAVLGLVGRADLLAALLTLTSLFILLLSPHTNSSGAEVLNNIKISVGDP
jgi:hypothetical protein